MAEREASPRRIQRLETKLSHEEEQLDRLEENRNALCRQLQGEGNAAQCNRLEWQIEQLEEEIDEALERYEETASQWESLTGKPVEDKSNPRKQRVSRRRESATKIPHNLPRSNARFVGRVTELETLHEQLQQNERIAISAIAGMGGIGKTELARQYAQNHLEHGTYPAGVCWLQARDANVVTQLVSFARTRLGTNLPDGLELVEQVAFCWQHWPPGEALIIFDDVVAYEQVQPYLPPGERRFKLLFTTRQQFSVVQALRLEVLQEKDAIALLAQMAGETRIQSQLKEAKLLCNGLGYLPLGLELVGRYLAEKPDLSLAQMQQRLDAKGLDAKALVKATPGMTGELGIAAAFELSWQELSPAAQQLGGLLSLFALAPIPWSLVESVAARLPAEALVPVEAEELEDLRDDALVKRHLLQRVGAGTYQLHQLVREFFSAKCQQGIVTEALKQSYCQEMVAVAKTIPQTPTRDQIAAVAPAIPHLEEAATTLSAGLSDEDVFWPFTGLVFYWQGQGAYAQAQPWCEQCLAAVRGRLGERHPDVATNLNNLAFLYHNQGRYEEAETLYRKALELRKQLLGERHPDVATSLNNLAALYDNQGRYGEAETLYLQALELRKQLLGECHPEVADSLNNLAALYSNQNRYTEAETLYLQAVQIAEQRLGPDHPHTLLFRQNLDRLRSQS